MIMYVLTILQGAVNPGKVHGAIHAPVDGLAGDR